MKSSLLGKLARNTAANYGGRLVVMATGFLLTPFLVRSLGDTQYGIWVLLGSVIAYFQLLDLGLSASLSKYVAEYLAQERELALNELCGTVFAAYLGLSAVAGLGIASLAPWFAQVFNIPAEDAALATGTYLLVGLNFVILLPTSILNAILVGYQRLDYNNVVGAVCQVLNALLIVLLLRQGLGLLAVAAVGIFTTLAMATGRLYFVRRSAPQLRFSPRLFRRDVARTVFGYSVAVFVIQIGGLILFRMDNILLGLLFPVAAITPYAVSWKLANLLNQAVLPLTAVLFPAYAEMGGRLDMRGLRVLYLEGSRGVTVIGGFLAVFLLMLGKDILALWVGQQYWDEGVTLYALIVFFFIVSVARLNGNLLVATGRARSRMYVAFGEVGAKLALCTGLALVMGPAGVAMGSAVSALLVFGLMLIPLVCRQLDISWLSWVRSSLLCALGPGLVAAGYLYVVQQYFPIDTWLAVAFYFGSSALLFGVAYFLLGVSRSERVGYMLRLRGLIRGKAFPES